MRYRAIRPISKPNSKRVIMPGEFIHGNTDPEWIDKMLEEDKIAVYKPSIEVEEDDK